MIIMKRGLVTSKTTPDAFEITSVKSVSVSLKRSCIRDQMRTVTTHLCDSFKPYQVAFSSSLNHGLTKQNRLSMVKMLQQNEKLML